MVDFKKVNQYVEKMEKPPYLSVDDEEWRNALLGFNESLLVGVTDDMGTGEYWNLVFIAAVGFCKGMEYAEVKAGIREASNYPRY